MSFRGETRVKPNALTVENETNKKNEETNSYLSLDDLPEPVELRLQPPLRSIPRQAPHKDPVLFLR